MNVLVFGSLNYDYVYRVDHILMPGETQSSSDFTLKLGGKGLNQAIACARAGAKVFMGGCIGEDGDLFLNVCKDAGIDTAFLRQEEGRSGHAIIQLDKDAQNSILLFGGTNRRQTKAHIDEVLSHFAKDDLLIVQNEINELPYLVEAAAKKGLRVVMNPSPFDDALQEVSLDGVSVFLINEVEGAQLTKEHDPEAILDAAAKRFPGAAVVLTLGDKGAWYTDAQSRCFVESVPCQVVDTTGAGDTFTGYFVAGLTEQMSPEDAMRLAAKAASIACSRMGAVDGIPLRREVG